MSHSVYKTSGCLVYTIVKFFRLINILLQAALFPTWARLAILVQGIVDPGELTGDSIHDQYK